MKSAQSLGQLLGPTTTMTTLTANEGGATQLEHHEGEPAKHYGDWPNAQGVSECHMSRAMLTS